MHVSTASQRSARWTNRSRYGHDPDDACSPASGMLADAMDAEGTEDVCICSIIAVLVRTAIMNCPLPPCSQLPAGIPAGC
jgi:hypothetical protein